MPACSNNPASREVTMATVPSSNSRATTRASLVLMSEATVPQGTRDVHSREAGTKAPQRVRSPILQVLSSLFAAELRDRP